MMKSISHHRRMKLLPVSIITSFGLQNDLVKLKRANRRVGFETDVVLIGGDEFDDMIGWNEAVLSAQNHQNVHHWFTASTHLDVNARIDSTSDHYHSLSLSPAVHCGCGLLTSWKLYAQSDVPVCDVFLRIHECAVVKNQKACSPVSFIPVTHDPGPACLLARKSKKRVSDP